MGRKDRPAMRRYLLNVRVLLLAGLLLALGLAFALALPAFAQEEQAPAVKKSLMSVILANKDPVFFIILILSVVGLTLIIQGFIKNRASVFMPETSTAAIREMIMAKKFKELIEFTEND